MESRVHHLLACLDVEWVRVTYLGLVVGVRVAGRGGGGGGDDGGGGGVVSVG